MPREVSNVCPQHKIASEEGKVTLLLCKFCTDGTCTDSMPRGAGSPQSLEDSLSEAISGCPATSL